MRRENKKQKPVPDQQGPEPNNTPGKFSIHEDDSSEHPLKASNEYNLLIMGLFSISMIGLV